MDVLVSKGRLEDLELPVEGMRHRLAIGSTIAVSVVEEERFNHLLIFDRKLRSHDVLSYLITKLFQSPAVI